MKLKMKPRTFLILAMIIVVITLIAINWKAIQAWLQKTSGSTPATGTTGTTTTGPVLTGGTTTTSGSTTNTNQPLNLNKVLQRGVTGSEVTRLQQILNSVNDSLHRISTNLVVDANFGTKTEAMLQAYAGTKQITLNQAANLYHQATGLYIYF